MNEKLSIFFDTSGLPRSLSEPGQAYGLLAELAEEGLAEVFIPEIVERERRSQVVQEFQEAQRKVIELGRSSAAAADDFALLFLDLELQMGMRDSDGWEQEAKNVLDASFARIKANIVRMDASDTPAMWELYFSGNLPFAQLKARKDIPDAFVFLAVKRIAAENPTRKIHCIIHDGRLSEAVGKLKGCVLHPSLKKFILGEVGQEALSELEWTKVWQEGFEHTIDEIAKSETSFESKVLEAVEEAIPDLVIDEGLPESVSNYVGAMPTDSGHFELEWNEAVSLGPGWLEVPLFATVPCDVSFSLHRSDVFSWSTPSWLHVELGDIDDKAFDVSGNRNLNVAGQARFQFTRLQFENGEWSKGSIEIELDSGGFELVEEEEY